MKRNYNLDKFRGLTIISMVLFHLMYNINFYWQVSWYDGTLLNKIWQLSIACSFFIISGISSNFLSSKENIKRGLITSLIGFAISLVTYFFTPEQMIIWGVLNGLGASMIITGFLQRYFAFDFKYFFIFLAIFIFTYNIPKGNLYSYSFFKNLYDNNLAILGFPGNKFVSSDYFPIIPWIFIYLSGFSLGKFLITNNFYYKYGKDNWLAKLGRHAMIVYLAHQVILYPIVTLVYKIITS
jgi:putative membrane protein